MKSSKYISILCVGSLLSLASCTDGFESDNKINGSFDDTVKEYDFQKYTTNFETIQKGIYFNYDWGEGTTWPWQTFQNLNHDMFSGYFHDFASKFSDKNTVYALEAGWTASAWNYTYNYIFPVAHKSTLITQDEAKYKHFYGATLILKVEAMHRITDTYGPIVYSKFGKNETNSVTPYFIVKDFAYKLNLEEMKALRAKLDASLDETMYVSQIDGFIKRMEDIQVGAVAPDFTLPDVDGNPVTLSGLRGKYVLIDFWASWCPDCRKENPNIVAAWNKYKDKNFTILGVSLDRKKEPWLAAIEKDQLAWTHVSDLKDWKSDAAVQYAIRWIPMNFLLDPNGVILAVGLEGEALQQKLDEVLK